MIQVTPELKFKKFVNPTIPYIDTLNQVSVHINKLMLEFELIKDKFKDVSHHDNKVLVQKKYHLMMHHKFEDVIEQMPYTKSVAEELFNHLPYNSINYRYVMPNTCYNWHQDTGLCCLHIPLITNPGCWFVYEHKSFFMPANGSVYIVNNGKMHTFINAGSEPRLHITFEIL